MEYGLFVKKGVCVCVSFQRYLDVMDVEETLRQRCVLTGRVNNTESPRVKSKNNKRISTKPCPTH